jgi:hypothetical protein
LALILPSPPCASLFPSFIQTSFVLLLPRPGRAFFQRKPRACSFRIMETIWPTGKINYRALDATFFLTSSCILSIFLARRIPLSLHSLGRLSLARWLVLALLTDS